MIDDSLGDNPGGTIEVVRRSDWLDHSEEVQGLVNAAIRNIDARRANGGLDSGITFTPAQPAAASHLDDSDAIAVTYSQGGNVEARRRAIEGQAARMEAETRAARTARAARAMELNPKPEYPLKNWEDPEMHGDAAAVTIAARSKIMKTAKPRTFVLPANGMLICSDEDDAVLTLEKGDAKLPALGIDFGYDPESETWISEKEDTDS